MVVPCRRNDDERSRREKNYTANSPRRDYDDSNCDTNSDSGDNSDCNVTAAYQRASYKNLMLLHNHKPFRSVSHMMLVLLFGATSTTTASTATAANNDDANAADGATTPATKPELFSTAALVLAILSTIVSIVAATFVAVYRKNSIVTVGQPL